MDAPSATTTPTGIARARVIDVHAHAVLEETMGQAGVHGPELGTDEQGRPWFRVGKHTLLGVKYRNSPFMDPELRIQRMDRAGIDFQVLSPNPLTYFHYIDAPDAIAFCRTHNDALARVVRRHPDRLGALAALPVQDIGAAVEELHRAVGELGMWGAQIGPDSPNPLHAPYFDPLYEACVKLNVPLFIHPANAGIDGPPGDPNLGRFDLGMVIGYAAQETIAVATLIFGGVLDRHPKLDIWVSHGGGAVAFLAGRLAQAGQMRPWAPDYMRADGAFEERLHRLWFDDHVHDPRALDLLLRVVGDHHMTFGTNFVGWDAPESIEGHDLPAKYADNARKLLRQG